MHYCLNVVARASSCLASLEAHLKDVYRGEIECALCNLFVYLLMSSWAVEKQHNWGFAVIILHQRL